ncbi:MAG TPA: efflux RND transporter periplasmic adaptor subunit [Chloroflexota bacterium]|nr:efflux RND transporter periplasmic adaptor subunit [Chloroflexota bacterium]
MRLWGRRCASALVALGIILSACTKLPEDYPTPTPVPTPTDSNKPVYTVTKGTIEQVVKALGRIAANQESIMYFRENGRLYHMYVETDQKVKKGDLLAELDTGTLKDQVQTAKVQWDIAQLKVQQAMGKDLSGQQSTVVVAAQAGVTAAEANLAKAQDNLTTLTQGPTHADVQSATAAVSAAESQLQKDQTALTQLQTPPTPDQIAVARAALDKATAALKQAQAAYDQVQSRPDIGALPQSAALQAATTDYNSAKAAYAIAMQGPQPDDVANLKKQIDADQAALKAADAKVAVLQEGPTAADLDAAKQGVVSAQSALDVARSTLDQALGAASGKSIGVEIAQKQADLAQLQYNTLKAQLDEAQLVAPFDGVVTETDNTDGDQIQAYTPVLTVSNPAKLEIAVELQPTDLANVQVGQKASIILSAFPNTTLTGQVIRMPAVASGNNPQLPANLRTVRLNLPTPPGQVQLGELANVAIDIQQKENVLILPTVAISTFGGRRFVRLVGPGNRPQEVDVTVGVSDDTNTEITKGLKVGDKVIAP